MFVKIFQWMKMSFLFGVCKQISIGQYESELVASVLLRIWFYGYVKKWALIFQLTMAIKI